MKIYKTGSITAGFILMVLTASIPAQAESFGEISMPAVISADLSAAGQEIFETSPVKAILSKEEAETFLTQLGISVKEKPSAKKWDPFRAARILQTSA